MKIINQYIICMLLTVLFIPDRVLLSQEKKPGSSDDYIFLYNNGKYNKSLEIINKILSEKYRKRVTYVSIPTDFISVKDTANTVDLKKIFRNRKAKGFFIEENNSIFQLHFYAARCYFKLKKYYDALNNYYQSLRFKKIEMDRDDIVLYEISQTYKNNNNFNAYINTLEIAYTLNRNRYNYSLELGTQLAATKQKKKSIFHLERYVNNSGGKIDPKIYLKIANLNEDVRKYLETEKYYKLYLKENNNDPYINFALGYIAYKRTGNYKLALSSFEKALELLPKSDIFRRSRSYEYVADISYSDLEFDNAIKNYMETIKYQDQVFREYNALKQKLKELNEKIFEIKASLITKKDYDDYSTYEFLLDEKGQLESKISLIKSNYTRLNPGKVRWNLADSYERKGELKESISYYRKAISFNYKSNIAREKIAKLQLKIKRGY